MTAPAKTREPSELVKRLRSENGTWPAALHRPLVDLMLKAADEIERLSAPPQQRVPREPTEEMMEAGRAAHEAQDDPRGVFRMNVVRAIWYAMYNAAPPSRAGTP